MRHFPRWTAVLLAASACSQGGGGIQNAFNHSPYGGAASLPPDGGAALPPSGGGAIDAGVAATAPPPGPPTSGCGSGGGGAGGPADLFPCDSPWYRDVSGYPVAPESGSIISAVANRGGWGAGNHLTIGFGFALIHADATVPRANVTISRVDSSDANPYYTGESDTVSGPRAWSVPMPPNGQLQGGTSYTCPQTWTSSGWINGADCHLSAIDETRHLLIEMYGAHFDAPTNTWHAQQESVWNLGWHYTSGHNRGTGCTSADAAGLPIAPGVIGLRETTDAAKQGTALQHALRFILPNDRTRRAFVPPASHLQVEAQLQSEGPPYGVRFRLKPSFDESRVSSPGARAIVRTLKKYGMVLADGGETALGADDENWVRKSDPSLTWSGLLGWMDLDALKVTDFEVVDYDASQVLASGGCVMDSSPLAAFAGQGRAGVRHRRGRGPGPRRAH